MDFTGTRGKHKQAAQQLSFSSLEELAATVADKVAARLLQMGIAGSKQKQSGTIEFGIKMRKTVMQQLSQNKLQKELLNELKQNEMFLKRKKTFENENSNFSIKKSK